MTTSGFRPYKEDENVKGPMEYVEETDECICGWCGQPLNSSHTNESPEAHFKSCKNSKDNGLLRVFKELRLVQQNLKLLNKKMYTVKAEVMEEIRTDHVNLKTEFNNEILGLKAKIKIELETMRKVVGEENDEALVAFNNQLIVLEGGMEKKMRAMKADQDMKLAEMSGRFTGVTETISTVVHSMLEGVRGKSSADTNELAPLKKDVETVSEQVLGTVSEQVKSNDRNLQVLKRQVEIEAGAAEESSAAKKKRLHVEDVLTIPMNSFNLVTNRHLFQPSYTWIIDGIQNKMERKKLELNSEMFQWNGYSVEARAKLQLREDGGVFLSLCLKDALKGENQLRDITPIPQVYYLLKHNSPTHARHRCFPTCYFSGSRFSSSLPFISGFIHKTWFNLSTYKVADSVEIEIYVEPSPCTQQVYSYDGTLEWKMENYARRLQLEKSGQVDYQESPYFYTGPNGYRVQIHIFLNGLGRRNGLIVRIWFLTGKFDPELPQSFPHSTTVTLVNRKDSQQNFSETMSKKNCKLLCDDVQLCKLEEVASFVENDALFCKVSIKAL